MGGDNSPEIATKTMRNSTARWIAVARLRSTLRAPPLQHTDAECLNFMAGVSKAGNLARPVPGSAGTDPSAAMGLPLGIPPWPSETQNGKRT